jgi:transposase
MVVLESEVCHPISPLSEETSRRAQDEERVKGETFWKGKADEWQRVVERQAVQIAELTSQLKEKDAQIQALTAKLVWFQQQLFGTKSEQSPKNDQQDQKADTVSSDSSGPSSELRRKRGQQTGSPGHGRKTHPELASLIVDHEIPEDQRQCPRCGKLMPEIAGTEDSEEISWEVHLVRKVHRRKRYVAACHCLKDASILVAPPPAKLIPKGMFSSEFWVRILLEKYLHQRPLNRIVEVLTIEGMSWISAGTLVGGLERIALVLDPLYAGILAHGRAADHWHMDETRWMVFVKVDGKEGYRWWMWMAISYDATVFILDPSRSAKVVKEFLGEETVGILNVDRYSAYKTLDPQRIVLAYCWAHVRRDFKKIRDGYPSLHSWGKGWVERINGIYRLNRRRLEVQTDREALGEADQRLRSAMAEMKRICDEQWADEGLALPARKALESLRVHWSGLTVFVDELEIPMDNNRAERAQRREVVGRKNYYGSGSVWSGHLAAKAFSIFETLRINRLNPKAWLLAYFEACARNGGKAPANAKDFLPWNLSEEQKRAWCYSPEHPP